MCSETSEAVGTNWEHAQLEIQKFLKIRIPLLQHQQRTKLMQQQQMLQHMTGRAHNTTRPCQFQQEHHNTPSLLSLL